jgi:hypothetical protein
MLFHGRQFVVFFLTEDFGRIGGGCLRWALAIKRLRLSQSFGELAGKR